MMAQQVWDRISGVNEAPEPSIEDKLQELTQSVSEVSKYELLTTNQYLKQMELILEIFNDISETIVHQ